jgi:GNAT superfamily N-acetyltransferase
MNHLRHILENTSEPTGLDYLEKLKKEYGFEEEDIFESSVDEELILKPHHIKVSIRPHPKDPKPFKAYYKGRVAGAAVWMKTDINHAHDKPSMFKSVVNPEYRGKGVAYQLYHHIEKHIGQQLYPSSVLSDDGYEFWTKYRPDAVKDDFRKYKMFSLGKNILMMNTVKVSYIVLGRMELW